jgi:hypothetical protein
MTIGSLTSSFCQSLNVNPLNELYNTVDEVVEGGQLCYETVSVGFLKLFIEVLRGLIESHLVTLDKFISLHILIIPYHQS